MTELRLEPRAPALRVCDLTSVRPGIVPAAVRGPEEIKSPCGHLPHTKY